MSRLSRLLRPMIFQEKRVRTPRQAGLQILIVDGDVAKLGIGGHPHPQLTLRRLVECMSSLVISELSASVAPR